MVLVKEINFSDDYSYEEIVGSYIEALGTLGPIIGEDKCLGYYVHNVCDKEFNMRPGTVFGNLDLSDLADNNLKQQLAYLNARFGEKINTSSDYPYFPYKIGIGEGQEYEFISGKITMSLNLAQRTLCINLRSNDSNDKYANMIAGHIYDMLKPLTMNPMRRKIAEYLTLLPGAQEVKDLVGHIRDYRNKEEPFQI